jgi:hypothetical protein
MKRLGKISSKTPVGKIISAITMIFLLGLLTCINQFIFGSSDKPSVAVSWSCDDEDPGPCFPNGPAGPDEKSPDAPVSINEEYIHEHAGVENPFLSNALFEHMIHEADKLRVVHFEILYPPPNA